MLQRLGQRFGGLFFAEPGYLVLLYVVLALAAFFALVLFLRLLRNPKKTHGSRYPLFPKMKFWFFVLVAGAFMIIALARPCLEGGSEFHKGSVDVIVVLDCSISMRASDLGPTRLEVAKREIMKLQDKILQKGDRVAFYVFATNSWRKLYLSHDFELFAEQVQRIGFPKRLVLDDFTIWDTDLALALEHVYQSLDAQDAFMKKNGPAFVFGSGENKPTRIVFLFTDGDDQVKDVQKLSQDIGEFRKRGIKIYPVGVGTRTGVPLPSAYQGYISGVDFEPYYVADLKGKYTRLETKTLELLADQTGGRRPITLENKEADASNFMRGAADFNRSFWTNANASDIEEKQELWWYALCAAMLVLVLAILFY